LKRCLLDLRGGCGRVETVHVNSAEIHLMTVHFF
jgi:hypothetical protein